MGKKQYYVDNKHLGRDSHVRNKHDNIFAEESTKSFGVITGEVSLVQAEPFYKQTMVNIKPTKGGNISSVAYPNAMIDPKTGNLNGLYEGVIPGQGVTVGFVDGNRHAPFVINKYPYQMVGNSINELKYSNPLTQKGWNSFDTILGHFGGSYLRFATLLPLPASTQLYSVTDLDIETKTFLRLKSLVQTEIKSNIVKIESGVQIELDGNTNYAVKYNELKIAFDQFKTDYNTFVSTIFNLHTHIITAPGTPSNVPVPVGIVSVADMSAAQNFKVRF